METTPQNPITGTIYQGENAAALAHAKEWATFLQWTRAGYKIKQGEHGVRILRVVDIDTDKRAVRRYTVFHSGQVEPVN